MRLIHVFLTLVIIMILATTCSAQFTTRFHHHQSGAHYAIQSTTRGAGDVNGDGIPDYVIGSPGQLAASIDPLTSGKAEVHSGADGSILHTLMSTTLNGQFGEAVAGVGDVNGDGYDDIAVGSPMDGTLGNLVGAMRMFSGVDGSLLYANRGNTAFGVYGSAICGLGDINNDGFDDILVSAPTWPNPASVYDGRVLLVSGLDASILLQVTAADKLRHVGDEVVNIGDVDQDGVDDIGVNHRNLFDEGMAAYSGADGTMLNDNSVASGRLPVRADWS